MGRSKGRGIHWLPRDDHNEALIKLIKQDRHATIDELRDRLEEMGFKHSWSAVQRTLNLVSRVVSIIETLGSYNHYG